MSSKFMISKSGKELGPWSLPEIAQKLSAQALAPTDYLYDEQKQDWVLLMEYGPLLEVIKQSFKPTVDPKAHTTTDLTKVVSKTVESQPKFEEWYVLKGEEKYGPFTHLDVVHMLQEKSIFEYDYVWKAPMEAWQRVAELKEFQADSVREMLQHTTTKQSEIFCRRRHARTDLESTLIVHNNKTVWKGEGVEISEAGAGVVIHNSLLLPGDKLYLHFKPLESLPPFNVFCEVVSKKFKKDINDKESPVCYGVKFVSLQNGAKENIKEFVVKKTA